MKDESCRKVMSMLHSQRVSNGKYVFKHGDEASQFYIVLDGIVSAWEPVKLRNMLKPILKLRQKAKKAIEDSEEKLDGFSF